jgi:hypothetical protein
METQALSCPVMGGSPTTPLDRKDFASDTACGIRKQDIRYAQSVASDGAPTTWHLHDRSEPPVNGQRRHIRLYWTAQSTYSVFVWAIQDHGPKGFLGHSWEFFDKNYKKHLLRKTYIVLPEASQSQEEQNVVREHLRARVPVFIEGKVVIKWLKKESHKKLKSVPLPPHIQRYGILGPVVVDTQPQGQPSRITVNEIWILHIS